MCLVMAATVVNSGSEAREVTGRGRGGVTQQHMR
jgi:hypothetical protein